MGTTSLNISIDFEQLMQVILQLPQYQQKEISKLLAKEQSQTPLPEILSSLKVENLSQKLIDEEVELVRQQRYDERKKD